MPSHEFADFRVDYNTAASDAPLSLRGTKDKVPGLLKTFNVFSHFVDEKFTKGNLRPEYYSELVAF